MDLKKIGFCKLNFNHNFASGFSRAVECNLVNLIPRIKTVSQRLQLLRLFPQEPPQNRLYSLPFLVAVQSTSAAATALTVTIGARLW